MPPSPPPGRVPRVLVVGAGPAGLATAVELGRQQVPHDLVDRTGTTGGAYRAMHPGILLSSPRGYNALPGQHLDAGQEYMTSGEYRSALERYARDHDLVAAARDVIRVERDPARSVFHVTFESEPSPEEYGAVVVATGQMSHPVRPTIPGLDEAVARDPEVARHTRDWDGPERYRGRKVLVIGGGTSGIESAEALADAGIPVQVSCEGFRIIPQRVWGRDIHVLAAWVEALPLVFARGHCETHPTIPGRDRGFTAHEAAGRIQRVPRIASLGIGEARLVDGTTIPIDRIVLATGYAFRTPFLPPEVTRVASGRYPRTRDGESVAWPGLFLVGFPCARGLASEFLRGIAADAPPLARRIARHVGIQPQQ